MLKRESIRLKIYPERRLSVENEGDNIPNALLVECLPGDFNIRADRGCNANTNYI